MFFLDPWIHKFFDAMRRVNHGSMFLPVVVYERFSLSEIKNYSRS